MADEYTTVKSAMEGLGGAQASIGDRMGIMRWVSMRKASQRPIPLALGLVAGLLWGCASTPKMPAGDPSLPEIDVLQLKENSDEALKLAQENKLDMQALQSKLKELDDRISSLGDEVANLPLSKLEELTQQLAMLSEQIRNLEERPARTAVVVTGPPTKKEMSTFAPTALAGDSAASAARPPLSPAKARAGHHERPVASSAEKVESKPPDKKPMATDVEAGMYKAAFDLYYGREYGAAIERFEDLLKKFPKGTYADNCQYWIGECNFALGNFAKAIMSFRKVLASSESEKADDAQLKLGYCYLRLGERKRAAEEFKKVVSLYPDSEYTERAKEELAKLE